MAEKMQFNLKGLTSIRPLVFWPPFTLLIVALAISILKPEEFVIFVNNLNNWVLSTFNSAFSIVTFLLVICCIIVFFTPLKNVRIGGEDAKPILTRWQWFSIVLCTTVATGILFWGTAEPIFHITAPPGYADAQPETEAAGRFAMKMMFLHWSFTPYAIYTIPALCFAIGFYNQKKPFSLRTMISPILNERYKIWGDVLDAVCLYALILGMAASLGAGILTLGGGVSFLTNIPNSWWLLALITLLIVAAFVVSAISGLFKGIKRLSSINAILFFVLAGYVLVFGPTGAMAKSLFVGVKDYIFSFAEMSLLGASGNEKEWSESWSTFYWANWMAWAPVSALFLGRISKGYTVKEFMLFNWVIPSVFAILWMSIFSGTSSFFELNGLADLSGALNNEGPEAVMYKILDVLPFTSWVIPLFLVAVFLSFVTAADSNTEAMSALSQSNDLHDINAKTPTFIKILWGMAIGAVSYTMINFSGIEGIKQLSNLGGLPILLLEILVMISFVYLVKQSFEKQKKAFRES